MALDKKIYRLLSRKVTASHAVHIIADCDALEHGKGGVAFARLRELYDPTGITYTANKVFALLGVFQDGQTAMEHISRIDTAVQSALRPFIGPDGRYDWEAFSKVMLASVYFMSFSEAVQDIARADIKNLTLQTFTYQKIRSVVMTDDNIQKLGRGRAWE